MNDREQSQEEDLERIFQVLNAPLSDRGFVRDVMRRSKRYGRIRRLLLGFSASIVLAISAGPFIQLSNRLAERLVMVHVLSSENTSLIAIEIVAVSILCAIALPSVLRWLSR